MRLGRAWFGCGLWLALGAVSLSWLTGCGDGTRIVLGQGSPASDAEASSRAGQFGPPDLVTELSSSSADDEKPTLTSDLLQIYFVSTRAGGPGGGDVWTASRATPADRWNAPTLVGALSSPQHEKSPAVSADGLTLWVASDRPGGQGGLDIWVSTRTTVDGDWSTPVAVPELSSPGDEIPRPPGAGGLVMPIARRAQPTDGYQTYAASRTAAGMPWMAPVRRDDVDTASIDTDGFLTDDGLTLYLSSDRIHTGDQDLFVATRHDSTAAFAAFTALAELDSTHADRDPWVSPDGHQMFFVSDRSGSLKIYDAVR
ncbi:MAG: hypothetical protein ACRENE_08855 [Polyangiaceae bacterium]